MREGKREDKKNVTEGMRNEMKYMRKEGSLVDGGDERMKRKETWGVRGGKREERDE